MATLSPEGRESSRAATQMRAIRPCYAQAEGALAGKAVAQRIGPVAPVSDAGRVRVKAPDGRLESVATLPPLVAILIAGLQEHSSLSGMMYIRTMHFWWCHSFRMPERTLV